MTTVYNNLSYNLTKQLDDSRVLSRLANSFEAYVQTQKDLVIERRVANLIEMTKLDQNQMDKLRDAISGDPKLRRWTNES